MFCVELIFWQFLKFGSLLGIFVSIFVALAIFIAMTWLDIEGKEELMSVDYTGFGWILVKKNVFESMEYPWFKPLWFQFGEAENGSLIKEFCSEDVGWCKTIKKLGYEIFVDPTIIVGHEKTIVYGKS